ncbi:MAG TPA: TIGR00730 family Rossman fold protein [Caulobacteraceae bacterium]
MSAEAVAIRSVGLFCGSSAGTDPAWAAAAAAFGRTLAGEGLRLVYGGGAIGLMGACARAAIGAGGQVLGVIPEFLRLPEVAYEAAELVVVASMHERKAVMFREADAFVVMPGGIGTLEEAIELLSWSRLELHAKPIVFLDLAGFWRPLFELFDHTVRQGFTPPQFASAYSAVGAVAELLPRLREMAAVAGAREPMPLTVT